MVVDAYYCFKLKPKVCVEKPCFSLKRLSKVGNNDLLNVVFEYFDTVNVFKLGPIENANGYMAYSIKGAGPVLEYGPIIFATSVQSGGYGSVKSLKKDDAILFRRLRDGVFEVYVFKGRYTSSILLLQMLKDGVFNYEIEKIKAKISE